DAQRVEEGAHHRPLLCEVVQNECASRDAFGQRRHAGEMPGFSIDGETDDGLWAELFSLRDEHRRLHLIVHGFLIGPECAGRGYALLGGHLFPQSCWCHSRLVHTTILTTSSISRHTTCNSRTTETVRRWN